MTNSQMHIDFSLDRLPKGLQERFKDLYDFKKQRSSVLKENTIYQADARDVLPYITQNSIAVSVWSPPYFVGKSYEKTGLLMIGSHL